MDEKQIFLLFLVLVSVFLYLCVHVDNKKSKKEAANAIKEGQEWQKEQNLLPKCYITIQTNENLYVTEPFYPHHTISWWCGNENFIFKHTSLGKAEHLIENSVKKGRFYLEKEKLYIPMCEIKSMEVCKC